MDDFLHRCDVIAMGIINAAQNIGMKKPIIIRLKGTNVEEAKKLIEVRTTANAVTFKSMSAIIISVVGIWISIDRYR